jgi:hypothetical protein
MSLIIPANSAAAGGGYDVANSLMFNRADSANMTRSASGSSATKSTFSFWVKRTLISAGGDFTQVIHNFYSAGTTYNKLYFDGNDQIIMKQQVSGSTQIQIMPSMKFRDASAWYHIVYIVDPTESTEANRVKVYVNGIQITSFGTSTYPAEDAAVRVEYDQFIGREYSGDSKFLDGYLAEFVFLDGVAASIGDLGKFDEDSGIWTPKDVSGLTFGSRGFYLDFEDSSALGNDAVGSNNFTANNLAATDQATDTCTNNFATLNVLDGASMAKNATFSQGNNTVVCSGTDYTPYGTTIGVSTGKWYAEFKANADMGDGMVGVFANYSGDLALTRYADSYGWYNASGGNIKTADSNMSGGASVGTYATNDIIQIALDLDNNKVHFNKNDSGWLNSGNPVNNTGGYAITDPASTSLGFYFMSAIDWGGGVRGNWNCNFGSPYFAISSGNADGDGFGNFEYAVPSGFFALCTKNLAEYG